MAYNRKAIREDQVLNGIKSRKVVSQQKGDSRMTVEMMAGSVSAMW